MIDLVCDNDTRILIPLEPNLSAEPAFSSPSQHSGSSQAITV